MCAERAFQTGNSPCEGSRAGAYAGCLEQRGARSHCGGSRGSKGKRVEEVRKTMDLVEPSRSLTGLQLSVCII